MSNVLAALGVQRGDRVAIVMPQRFETAVAHMAVLQMGAVAMPLSMLFGPEALEYRLQDSEAVLAICDEALDQRAAGACAPTARALSTRDRRRRGAARRAIWTGRRLLARGVARLRRPCDTLADDAAVLIYTSGTTGTPRAR